MLLANGTKQLFECRKGSDVLTIPSNLISRIGSPENNLAETPNSEGYHFSFFEAETDRDYHHISSTPKCGNLSQTVILKELEIL